MANIHDINIYDAKKFLLANNKNLPDNNEELYSIVKSLMKNSANIREGVPNTITKWMIANNAFKNKVNIPFYSRSELLLLPLKDRNELAKKLGMKGNDIYNIIDIVKFLHKLEIPKILLKDTNMKFTDLFKLKNESYHNFRMSIAQTQIPSSNTVYILNNDLKAQDEYIYVSSNKFDLYNNKPIVLYNKDGFTEPEILYQLIRSLPEEKFLKANGNDSIFVELEMQEDGIYELIIEY